MERLNDELKGWPKKSLVIAGMPVAPLKLSCPLNGGIPYVTRGLTAVLTF